MNFKHKLKYLYVFLIILTSLESYSSIVIYPVSDLNIPSKNSFSLNTKYVRPFKLKGLTVAEYITDPLIMYASLWGCLGLTITLWETNGSVWEPDGERGFNKLYDKPYYHIIDQNSGYMADDTFVDRMKMEPFASGRIDPITKVYNSNTVFRGDIYAKNIIEPIYFTYLALYMRAKSYHPAIMITELILLSLLYEFTIRPFYLDSSFEQFIKNPAIAITVGLLFGELSDLLLSTPYVGLHVLGYILNPFNALPNSRIHPMLFFEPYRQRIKIEAVITLD